MNMKTAATACNRRKKRNARCAGDLAWREVRNCYGDDSRQMAVLQPELILRPADEDNGNYQTVPVARLFRDGQGNRSQDAAFIPPLLSVQTNPWLAEQLEQLLSQLRIRLQRLMAMRRESNERMADFTVADVSLFWLLNALNSAEPVLGHFQHHPQVHPERLYLVLAGLAGSLLTFSLTIPPTDIPAYRHDRPDGGLSAAVCPAGGAAGGQPAVKGGGN